MPASPTPPDGSPGDHALEVERAFTAQADAFEDPARNRVFTTDAHWALDRVPAGPDALVLDVAGGTGLAARRLAARVRFAVVVDATDAMLARGQAQARGGGVANVAYVRGDATALPFPDGAFDVAVCRFAVHHFADPSAAVAEMVRCLRPGGHLGLIDLIADDDPQVAGEQNRLERLRDRSHTEMLPLAGLTALVRDAGLADIDPESRPVRRPLQPWLDQAGAPDAVVREIHDRLRAELAGDAPASGFSPQDRDGALWFSHVFCGCVAVAAG